MAANDTSTARNSYYAGPEDHGFTCYICRERNKPILNMRGMVPPNDWICLDCLAKKIIGGELVLLTSVRHKQLTTGSNTESDDDTVTFTESEYPRCNSCGDRVRMNHVKTGYDKVYCENCGNDSCEHQCDHDCGEGDHTDNCNYCGNSYGAVYCREHAKSEWSLVDEDEFVCDDGACDDQATHHQCDAHHKHLSNQPTTVVAAEPFVSGSAVVSEDGTSVEIDGIRVQF